MTKFSFCTHTHFLLFIVLFASVSLSSSQDCRPQEYQLTSESQLLNISSPGYPNAIVPGSTCRYRIRAPLDHVVVVNCQFEMYPDVCSSEYFYISRDGDLQFRDGEILCRGSQFVRVSHFRSLAIAYYSTSSGTTQRSRFFCQAYVRRQPCNCGWTAATKITNGQEAGVHEFPSMVALRDVESSQRVFCGGSIISHRHIITAAHCLASRRDPSKLLAYVGDHDLTATGESLFEAQHRIREIIIHPAYTSLSSSMANDVALLVTSSPIEWSRAVGPICLPFRQAAESFPYVNVEVAGWGTLSFAGSKSNTLQKAELLTMDNRACQIQYNATILPSQLCSYDYLGLGRDSCQYDSGGPVIFRQQRMFLLAVISYGRTCGTQYAIGVNTRTTTHLNWLWGYVRNDESVCSI